MYRNPQIYNNIGCLFVHVPKTAGTSIEKCLQEVNDKQQVVGGHSTCDALIKHKTKDFSNLFTFTIVRNPWDRLVSAYLYMHKMGTSDILGNSEIKKYKTFDSFVAEYCNEKTINENMHLKPQHLFLCVNGKLAVDYWGKYEELEHSWKVICKKINKNIKLPWLNKSNETREYKSYYTSQTKEKVRKLYMKDIQMFNYTFD